jgi:hypothetical protein
MQRGDFVTSGQIRNRLRDFEDAMKRPRGELQLLHGRPHQQLAGRIKLARQRAAGACPHCTPRANRAKRIVCAVARARPRREPRRLTTVRPNARP